VLNDISHAPPSHLKFQSWIQDGGRGTHVTNFVQLYPQPLYTASQVRTTSRSWDKGVLTDLCLTLYITVRCQNQSESGFSYFCHVIHFYSTKPVTKEQFHNYRRPVTAHYLKTVVILSLLTAILHIFYRRPYCYSITQKLKICATRYS
jgi:hypothetical protein